RRITIHRPRSSRQSRRPCRTRSGKSAGAKRPAWKRWSRPCRSAGLRLLFAAGSAATEDTHRSRRPAWAPARGTRFLPRLVNRSTLHRLENAFAALQKSAGMILPGVGIWPLEGIRAVAKTRHAQVRILQSCETYCTRKTNWLRLFLKWRKLPRTE